MTRGFLSERIDQLMLELERTSMELGHRWTAEFELHSAFPEIDRAVEEDAEVEEEDAEAGEEDAESEEEEGR